MILAPPAAERQIRFGNLTPSEFRVFADHGGPLGLKYAVLQEITVTAKQVMKIILIQKKLQARTIEENTIIIFPDNETNRQRYGQYEIWPSKSDANK